MIKGLSLTIKLTMLFFITSATIAGANLYYQTAFNSASDMQAALAINGGTVVLVTIIGTLVGSHFTRRVNQIKDSTQRFANGDFSNRLPITLHDELGEVSQNFNQMSDRLQESYHRLAVEKQRDEAILQSMGEGLIAVDEKGCIVLLNAKARNMLQLGASEAILGQELDTLTTFYDGKQKVTARQTPTHKTLHNGRPHTETLSFVKKEGSKILLSISVNPIVLQKTVVGAIVVLRDVTREHEIDRMKTEFISLASHQLRTPLSAIKWFSEMLLAGDAGKLNDEQWDFSKNIADSTERMIDLVNSLLNISRIESGRIMIEPRPTDLKALVNDIVSDLKAKTEEKQQTLVISVHSGLPKINLDPRLISQVYLNLLTNAIKYTPKGGEILVFISEKDNEVVSQITDNGYGIPKAQQARLFQKFFRASNAVKVETDGTGLGLYLIKAIIESSGGKIWFESEEGKGSTFWFSIPLSGMQPKQGEVTLDM